MTLSDLSSKVFDPLVENMEKLSKGQRMGIVVGIFLVVIGLVGYFSYYQKFTEITQLKQDIEELERNLTIATRKARQLKRFRDKMAGKEAEFKIAKKALPDKSEIPALVTAISGSGHDAGLEFLLFQPKPEEKKDFYAEIPVAIKVKGSYHNLALFFDKVARLFRIVILTDIRMKAIKETNILNTSCTAVTFRFIEPAPDKGKKK
jgi:type IV pilus assembly protein PilO